MPHSPSSNNKPKFYTPSPEALRRVVQRQANRLLPDDIEWQAAFTDAVCSAQAGRPAIFWIGERPEKVSFATEKLTGWQPDWVDVLADPGTAAGQHPLFHEGAYYLLDFSSILSASVLLTIKQPVRTILDLCSAPGGKGIFAWRALQPELLLCNEVIGKRIRSLASNLGRCKIVGSQITQTDPGPLASASPSSFDLVIVDAPCSGQSLPAKGDLAPGAYQPSMISMNMARQRRILANAATLTAPGGHLAYMTCTYSREENEKNVEWLLRRFPEFEAVEVPHLVAQRSPLAPFPCYRHSPQEGLGVGGFTALLRKQGEPHPLSNGPRMERIRTVWTYAPERLADNLPEA